MKLKELVWQDATNGCIAEEQITTEECVLSFFYSVSQNLLDMSFPDIDLKMSVSSIEEGKALAEEQRALFWDKFISQILQ